MFALKKLLVGTAAVAGLAAAAPVSAQYYSNPYNAYNGYNTYNRYNTYNGYNGYNGYNTYQNGYGAYGGAYAANTSLATQQCTAAVQSRLNNRVSIGQILGAVLGTSTPAGRVLSITQVDPRSNGMVRVKGYATSGRYAYNGYGAYGVGAYGALGYSGAAPADLRFNCDVDYRGYVRDVNIVRR